MDRLIDNSLFKDYVSPNFCLQLMKAGFTPYMETFWRGYLHGPMDIISFKFDQDDYYREGAIAADMFSRPDYLLGAFTIADMEKHLPDYCVCRCNTQYEICVDKNFGVDASHSDRLPDAFASMMLALIKKRVVNLEKIKIA